MGSFATVVFFNAYLVQDVKTALLVLLGAVSCLLLIACVTGIAAGLFPALAASRTDLINGLKDTSRSATAGRSHAFLRQIFVGVEVAVSLVLLIAAGLLLRSFLNLENVSPGFQTENSLSFELSLPNAGYKNRQSVSNTHARCAHTRKAFGRLMVFTPVSQSSISECVNRASGAEYHASDSWLQ